MSEQLYKVWPLRQGVSGCTSGGVSTILAAGIPGWMYLSDAKAAEERGDVQIMALLGATPLGTPDYELSTTFDSPPRRKRKYTRRKPLGESADALLESEADEENESNSDD